MHDIARRAVFAESDAYLFLSHRSQASKGGILLCEHVVYFYVIIGFPSASEIKEQRNGLKMIG